MFLSVPASFFASVIYAFFIGEVTLRPRSLVSPLICAFWILLGFAALEFVGVATVGAIRLREALGEAYYPIHIALFALAQLSQFEAKTQRKSLIYRPSEGQGLHYTSAGSWAGWFGGRVGRTWPAVIRGGGWGGSVRPSFSRIICCSASGSV